MLLSSRNEPDLEGPTAPVTDDDLIEALVAAMRVPPRGDAMTAHEIATAIGISINKTRKLLRQLKYSSRLEVILVCRTDISNRRTWVPGYKLAAPEERTLDSKDD